MVEYWDAYDKDFNIIADLVLERGKMSEFPDGVYHLVVDVAVKHWDGTYLLMQRDLNKNIYPGLWELSAGGAAIKGETALEAATRELYEETGIMVDELKEIGRIVSERGRSIHVCYLCETDCNKNSIVLQEGETMAFRWVRKKTLDREVWGLASDRAYSCLFK